MASDWSEWNHSFLEAAESAFENERFLSAFRIGGKYSEGYRDIMLERAGGYQQCETCCSTHTLLSQFKQSRNSTPPSHGANILILPSNLFLPHRNLPPSITPPRPSTASSSQCSSDSRHRPPAPTASRPAAP